MATTGGVRAEAGVAWRVWKKAAGRIKAVVVRGATLGVCGEQEVALVRLQRRRAAAKSGSGRWQAAWQDRERPAGFGEAAALGLRRHVAQCRAARGRHMAGAGDGAAQRRNRGVRLEEEDEDCSMIFQKCRDSTVKTR
jgi:hypothetical protein